MSVFCGKMGGGGGGCGLYSSAAYTPENTVHLFPEHNTVVTVVTNIYNAHEPIKYNYKAKTNNDLVSGRPTGPLFPKF